MNVATPTSLYRASRNERFFSVLTKLLGVVAFFALPSFALAQNSGADPYDLQMDEENVAKVTESLVAVWKTIQMWLLIACLPAAAFIIFVMKGRGILILVSVVLLIIFGLPAIRFFGELAGLDVTAFK